MKLGIEKTAIIRVRAGVSYALTEAMDEGHCGLPTDELVPLAHELLGVNWANAPDHARREVLLDAVGRGRGRCAQETRFKLLA